MTRRPLGAVIGGQVDQSYVAAVAVDQGADGGLVEPPGDEVALPVADADAGVGGAWTVVDQQGGGDEPAASLVGAASSFAQRSSGA